MRCPTSSRVMEDIPVGGRPGRRHAQEMAPAGCRGTSRCFALVDLARRARPSRPSPLRTIRRIAAALDIRIDIVARWRGGELDRLLAARHSTLAEAVAIISSLPGWALAPEVSFSISGERGMIDILAFHEPTGSLLVIELKTAIVDVNELVGSVDRKRRLAAPIRGGPRLAVERPVSCWVIVAAGRTNRGRIEAHRTILRSAFPVSGRTMRGWLRRPVGRVAARRCGHPSCPWH